MSEPNETLLVLLKQHFLDDEKSFGEIKANQKKFQEINAQNGEHFSHFNSLLVEMKQMIVEDRKEAKAHRERVEPMLLSWEDSIATGKVLKGWGRNVGYIASAIIALYAIRDFIVNHFLK